MKYIAAVAALALPLAASSQVFFDDFNDLKPYWKLYNGDTNDVQYDLGVSDGWLHVTRVAGPNERNLISLFTDGTVGISLREFVLTTRVAWDPGEAQMLGVTMNHGHEWFGRRNLVYRTWPGEGSFVCMAGDGFGSICVDTPPPSIHMFRLVKTTNSMTAFLDGQEFAQRFDNPDLFGGVALIFSGPSFANSDQFGGLHVDWVRVDAVPEPSSLAVLCIGAMFCYRERMKRR